MGVAYRADSGEQMGSATSGEQGRRRGLMLALATTGFAVNFWAWALISPLGPMFRDSGVLGELSESDVALLVAVPVLVGSLGRIVVGALTDRYGGRIMFPVISTATILPVLFIGFFALNSYALLLVGGFFLGIAGTVFAVGVPFVNAWFPPERRGLAIGVFGAGMGGTAISALTTVQLFTQQGEQAPFLITAVVLAIYAVLAWVFLRDAPGRVVPTSSLISRLNANARLAITWQASILYTVAFGGAIGAVPHEVPRARRHRPRRDVDLGHAGRPGNPRRHRRKPGQSSCGDHIRAR